MSKLLFTENQKTILSIDFDRQNTCLQFCSYCYVENMERIYPTYLNKITINSQNAKQGPIEFASQLNKEYIKARGSKSKKYIRLEKLPVRVYGSGDYLKEHFKFLNHLDFKFFIISKNLTRKEYTGEIGKLLKIPNLTSIVLSLDDQNILSSYHRVKKYKKQNKLKLCYTGMPDAFKSWKESGIEVDIFFNISKKQVERLKSREFKEHCPCDSGLMKLAQSCTLCSKCWRSSSTKMRGWNSIN